MVIIFHLLLFLPLFTKGIGSNSVRSRKELLSLERDGSVFLSFFFSFLQRERERSGMESAMGKLFGELINSLSVERLEEEILY